MRDVEPRMTCGGGKGGSDTYDPYVAQAAAQSAATAQQAENFSESYTNQYITPLISQMISSSSQSQDEQKQLYDLNYGLAKSQADTYNQYGLPAQQAFYKTVNDYSEDGYREQQANTALGDVRAAETTQQGTMARRMQSMGINPTSPAYVSAQRDMAVANTAAEASAMNQARSTARDLGINLKAQAANLASGGLASTTALTSGASTSANSAASIAQSAIGSASSGANVNLSGYGLGVSAYGNNMSNYSKLASEDMASQAQSSAGWGNLAGTILGKFI